MRFGMLVGVLAAMGPATAHGQEATSERDAQARFEEGLARVRAGNFEGARASFLQAYAVLQTPSILWNLALAEEKTGNTLSALGHYKQFARVGPADDGRPVAEKHIGDLMGQTGHVDVAAPTGAQIVLDGALAGVAPLGDTLDVLPGRHRLEVQTAQGTRKAVTDVAPGQFVHVSLMLATETAASPPTSIRLAPAGAGEARAAPAPASGDHGAYEARGAEDDSASKGRVIAVAATGATAAILVGVGVYFTLRSQDEWNKADAYRSQVGLSGCLQSSMDPCPALRDAVQAQGRDATLSNVFYVAGGVLAAGAVATWFLWPKAPARAAAGTTLTLSATGTALRVAGSF
jgi:tetratricopeptide (TPR) repeat protein